MAFALLPDKMQSTYETLFHYLLQQCVVTGLKCEPQQILTDCREVAEAFAEDIMFDMPADTRCSTFAD